MVIRSMTPTVTVVNVDRMSAFLGAVFLVAVIAIARLASIAYAVPVGLLALDWFCLAPTHPLE
jgi:hypothetical protein